MTKLTKMTSVLRKVSDQPLLSPSLIRVFAVCTEKPKALNYTCMSLSAQRRHRPDCVDVQADRSIHWDLMENKIKCYGEVAVQHRAS